jgi:hyperosmotically inducible protein
MEAETFMPRRNLAALSLLAVVMLMLSACAGNSGASDDGAITEKVEAAIAADPRLSETHIHVHTDGGVVKLTGKVDTQLQSALAGQDSDPVPGVKAVANMLTVLRAKPLTQ